MIKIHGKGMQTLCRTCRRATVVDDATESGRIYCHALSNFEGPKRIDFPVISCSEFEDASQPSEHDMEKVAWVINPKKTHEIGFVRPGTDEHKKLTRGF